MNDTDINLLIASTLLNEVPLMYSQFLFGEEYCLECERQSALNFSGWCRLVRKFINGAVESRLSELQWVDIQCKYFIGKNV